MRPLSGERARRLLCCLAIAAALLPPCSGEETLKIGSTGSAIGMLKMLAAGFEKSHRGIAVEVLPSLGSSGAIKAFLQGAIDVAVSSRSLSESEKLQGLSLRDLARTPLVAVTERGTAQTGLTSGELVRIYSGDQKAWADGRRIRPIMRLASEADTLILKGISPEMNAAVDRALSREGMQIAATDQENIALIAKIPGSLGFATLAQCVTESSPVKILAFDGVAPDRRALSDLAYPLWKSFSVVTGPSLSGRGALFVDFATSAEGGRIVERAGCLFDGGM